MIYRIRKRELADATDYISAMLSADETFAFPITIAGKVIGSIGATIRL